MPDQQLTNGEKPNFYSLYLMVGEMRADIKDMRKDLEKVCEVARLAKEKADAVQNKAIGASIGVSILISILGFFTDWFGLRK